MSIKSVTANQYRVVGHCSDDVSRNCSDDICSNSYVMLILMSQHNAISQLMKRQLSHRRPAKD